ncbi:NACHT domain-containing protein [Pseudomonas inefficax]|uniref:NACHT domain-containing protein n=1 Tax=Pseudomonas inefficax TaxID=2078786 RepID=UPI0040469765
MTRPLNAFIDLDRTFCKIPFDSDASDDVDLSGRLSRSGELRWADLLQHQRVILLSEAGSGKTAEIRNVTRQLRSQGKTAFFLRIENVYPDLEDAIEEGSFEEFESWLDSGAEGWLFMDSVDEARLKDPRDFERAIRKIGRLTQRLGAQVHLLITGRSTAWRARTDLAICESTFAFAPIAKQAPTSATDVPEDEAHTVPTETESGGSFLVVTLDDIHGEQVDRFLAATGVTDGKSFRAELDRRDAWSLTTRPLDFLELVDYWHAHHRIGSRLELMRSSIDRRLEEHDQNRAEIKPIAPERLREGVCLIAAATTLGQMSAVRVPDGDANKKGIPVRSVLKDWNDADAGTLLSRPIFEPGIYGTVRFHHRTVREYLTAEWLHELIRGSASRVKIENLFFRTQYGLQVINPSLRPVLPWLALLDDRICARLEEVAPEVFFEGGDPGQLPLTTRRNVLRKTCEHLAQPAHSWSMTDYSAVQRFAHHDLTGDINDLLALYSTNDDITWFLLHMIWQGEVVGALAEAKQFALTAQHKHTRLAAIRAVIDLGTPQDVADLRQGLLNGDEDINREWLAELVDILPPNDDSIRWLLDAIQRAAKKERYSGRDSLAINLSNLAVDLPLAHIPTFIRGLGELLAKPPTKDHGFIAISKRYIWLAEIAGQCVLRLIHERDPFALDEAAVAILSKLALAHVYDERDIRELGENLRATVPTWPELDYKLFWYDVEVARKGRLHRNAPVINVWQLIGFRPFWTLNKQNFSRACDQISSLTEFQDRHMTMSMAFEIYKQHGTPIEWQVQLRRATESDAELSDKLELMLNPPPRQVEEWEIQQAQWKEEAALREGEEANRRREWREGLAADVARINSPEPGVMTRCQAYLLEEMRDGTSSSSTWSSGNWQSLALEFGMPVAQAFRVGAINFWRGYCPQLPSEGAPANTTPYQVIFGLTGLAIEAREESSSFLQMSCRDAEYAVRYALLELNGFPEWLPTLFKHWPQSVLEIVEREICYELSQPCSDSGGNRVLRRLRYGGEWLYEALSTPLMTRLAQPVKTLESLQLVMSVVVESSISDQALAELASERAIAENDLDIAPSWFALWIGSEPAEGIPALAARLDLLPSDDAKAQFAMLCLIGIVGGHNAHRCRQNYKTVGHAKGLYLLVNEYVRTADDIQRAGTGVYSPGLRDDAQNARDGLLALIRDGDFQGSCRVSVSRCL